MLYINHIPIPNVQWNEHERLLQRYDIKIYEEQQLNSTLNKKESVKNIQAHKNSFSTEIIIPLSIINSSSTSPSNTGMAPDT